MIEEIKEGIWPTMVTPFTKQNTIDYTALEELVEWYVSNEADGLFAVCQSSEMFELTLEERIKVSAFVNRCAGGRIPVIASGHVSDTFEEQLREIVRIAETGVAAVVLVTNRLALPDESEEQWYVHLENLLEKLPSSIKLGLYECPHPYKRVLSPGLLKKCSETGRFLFLKDTCCDPGLIRDKIRAVSGTGLKLFNANTMTLLSSLQDGAAGYSGVMANFHPRLYRWLFDNWRILPEKALLLSRLLGMASWMERQLYPVNAKYHFQLEGLHLELLCRTKNYEEFSGLYRFEVEELRELEKLAEACLSAHR